MRDRSNHTNTSLRSASRWRSNPLLITLELIIRNFAHSTQFVIILCFLFGTVPTFAQSDIAEMEYYVDNDPGFGSATPITITSGAIVDIPLELIDAATLPAGFHTVGVRAKNTTGLWGFTEKRQFYIFLRQ